MTTQATRPPLQALTTRWTPFHRLYEVEYVDGKGSSLETA